MITTTTMPSAGPFLLMIGVILYLGIIGTWLFERYKIPDVLNLIIIGLILGPVLHLIDPALLTPWMPVVGSIALGLILFEGGLGLELDHILERFGVAFLLATGTFLSTSGLIAVLYHGITGASWIHSLLFGATLGCVSSAVILPISSLLTVPEDVKTTIHLEAALSDMWGVVLTLVLIRLAALNTFDPGHTINALVGAFTTAIVGAGVFGMLWLVFLDRFRGSEFAYMMTLAAVFVLYGLTEMLHGSGPMAALTFGAMLTNADKVAKLFRQKFKFVLDEKIRWFNTEITFFARTFFFVYLGLVVSFKSWNISFIIMLISVMAAILICRWLVVRGTTLAFYPEERSYMSVYNSMLPRGLTSAVLVGVVQAKVPGTDQFLEYAFAVIFLTNILMTWWVYRNERVLAGEEGDSKNGKAAAT
jgi:cell volume regulation protein A